MLALWDKIVKEAAVIKAAPISAVTLLFVGIAAGVITGAWHYSERLELQATQIQRYRVALGIDEGGPNALAELSNAELQAKALNIASQVRDLCFSFQKRSEQIKPATKGNKKEEQERSDTEMGLMKEISQEFDHDMKSDFVNANNELLQRLDRKAVAGVVRGPIITDAETGTPVAMASLIQGQLEAPFLCMYADQMEQMAKLLPNK
jgi:hypothetical protein